MSEPKCAACQHCELRQCALEWLDNTSTGTVKRRITVAATAHEVFPAHHVFRHWCHGTKFKPLGYGAERKI